jgi:hypothetical protein
MLVGVLGLALALVLAEPPATDPPWPAGCPSRAAVDDRIRALAGRVPADEELRVRARVEGPPWVVDIELARDGITHTRRITAESCDAIANIVAVVVAVALDPVSVATRVEARPILGAPPAMPATARERESSAIRSRESSVATTRSIASPSPAAVSRSVPMRLAMRVAAGGEVGATLRGTGGVELALAWTRGRFALELVGRYWIRRRNTLANVASLRTELGTVGVRGCGVGAVTRVRFSGCVGIETGDFVARAFDVRGGRTAHFPWLAATLGGALAITLVEPVSLWVGLEGAAHVLRPQAVLDDAERTSLHHVAPAGLRALAGLELRLFGLPGPARARSAPP